MKGVFLSNLPISSTREQLMTLIKERLRQNDAELSVSLYVSEDGKRKTAVVSGFSSNVEEICKLLIGTKIGTRCIRVKLDAGDERNEFGGFLNPHKGSERRVYKCLEGDNSRKVTLILDQRFEDSLQKIFDFQSPRCYLYLNGLNEKVLDSAGRLVMMDPCTRRNKEHGGRFTIIAYETVLESIQAICMINKMATAQGDVVFTDWKGENVCALNLQCGIGQHGRVMDVKEQSENRGYVPVLQLSEHVLAKDKLKKLTSTCWKCASAGRMSTFQIIGVCPNLNFLAARCHCSYLEDLPVTHIDRPFKHEGEDFTRLTPNRPSGEADLVISHDPMRVHYHSAKHYQQIVAPIMYDEWKTFSNRFKQQNTVDQAVIKQYEMIETVISKSNVVTDVYHLEVAVPSSEFWREESIYTIRNITVTMNMKRNDNEFPRNTEIRRGNVSRVFRESEKVTRLYIKLKLPEGYVPDVTKTVKLVPKPMKLEYKNTVQVIKKMAKGELNSKFITIILEPDWINSTPPGGIMTKISSQGMFRSHIFSLKRSLNEEQCAAYEEARKSSVSVVQGPPGTGKTHWAAVTTALLTLSEHGCVLACATSNEAANALAVSIGRVFKRFRVPWKIVRVFSQSKEKEFLRLNKNPLSDNGVTSLHWEVRKDPGWLLGDRFTQIKNYFDSGKTHLLLEEQIQLLESHKSDLERQHLSKYQVFVSTIGALADKRILSWNSGRKITTVLIDEVGQTKQTEIPFLFKFKPKRTCLIGDHLQLEPLVESIGATRAGLGISCMKWLELGGKRVPWTMLKEQHRMNPNIRDLTSHVTYDDLLRDANVISTREDKIPPLLYQTFVDLKNNDILLYSHKFPESRNRSGSVYNEEEGKLVCQIIRKVLGGGLEAKNLTVLTFYEAQNQLIKSLLRASNTEPVQVVNVDAFQGRENHVIILSLSRSNQTGQMGFARTVNRLNVAISRAMFKMIICCNLNHLTSRDLRGWRKFGERIRTCAKIIDVQSKENPDML